MKRRLSRYRWRLYYWVIYRQEPELRIFMTRRRIWGGERITIERQVQLGITKALIEDILADSQ